MANPSVAEMPLSPERPEGAALLHEDVSFSFFHRCIMHLLPSRVLSFFPLIDFIPRPEF
jgi:hypothetical protein